MRKEEKLSEDQRKNIEEFLRMVLFMTDEQMLAMEGQIPMTQELFESCVESCLEMELERQFFKLLKEFPEFAEKYVGKIEKEMEAVTLPAK